MGAFININNSWKTVTKYFVNVAGTFKAVTDGFININGAWKRFFTGALVPEQQVTISQSTNSTTYLVTLTGTNYAWSPGPPLLTYYFEWSNNGGVTWSTLSTGNAVNPAFGSSTSYTHQVTVNQVSANVLNRYRFRVSGSYGEINGESISTITTIQGPTNITLTAGTPTANTIPINWTASTGANRYLVEYSSDGGTIYNQYSWVGTTYETLSSLTPGVEYKIRVTPYTGSGATSTYKGYIGNTSNIVTVSTVGLPKVTGVTATTPAIYAPTQPWLGAYSTSVSWDSVTGAGSYKIEVRTAPAGQSFSAWTHLAWVNHPTVTYLYTGLSNAYSYEIRVSAYTGQASGTAGPVSDAYFFSIQNPAGAFSISSVTKAYPVTSAQGSVRTVTASWGSSIWAYLYQYQIQASNDGINYSVVNSGTGTPVTFSNFSTTNTSLTISVVNSRYYLFHVRAVSGFNDSNLTSPPYASNGLFEATGSNPSVPTGFIFSGGVGTISVNWDPSQYSQNASASGSNVVNGLQYSIDNGAWSATQTADPFTITGLTQGQTYGIRLRAINDDQLVSNPTLSQNVYVAVDVPGPVRNLTVQSAAASNVFNNKYISWDAPNTGGPVTSYEYNVYQDGLSMFGWESTGASTNITIGSLSTSSSYYVSVRAIGPGGTSSIVNSRTFRIPRITSGPSASNISSNLATISWNSTNQSTYILTTNPSSAGSSGTTQFSTNLVNLSASTNYTATLTVSSNTGDSVSGSTSFNTSAPLGSFTYSISDGTVTPGTPNAFTLFFSSGQATYDWNDTSNTSIWISSISGGPEGFRSNGRAVSNDFWTATQGYSYTASVYSINQTTQATISWGSSTGAGSYTVSYTRSGASNSNGTFTQTTTGNSLSFLAAGGSITVNSVTAYSNTNGTGSFLNGTLSGSNFVTPTEKYSSTTSASGTYALPTYTVTWNANGGSGGGSTGPFAQGTAHTAPSPGTRSGYSFNGYYNTPSGDYTYGPIASGGSFTPPSSITMYARWSIVPSGTAPATPTNGGGTYATGTNYTTNATFTRSSSGTTPITYYWSVAASTSSSGPWTPWNSGTISSSTLGGTQSIPQQAWNQSLYGNWARYQVYAQNSVGTSGTLEWLL